MSSFSPQVPAIMRLSVASRLLYRFPERREVLLFVEAARTPRQQVLTDTLSIAAADDLLRVSDAETGERHTVFTAQGDVEILYSAQVEVTAEADDMTAAGAARIRDLPPHVLPFLRPSRYCPSDRFERLAQREFGHLAGGAKVSAILAWVENHLAYEFGASDPFTTAHETFIEAAGVCRDFTHLAVTLCRAADIPARAVSAYAWRLQPADMHAVVEVFLDGRWWLADPTGKAPVDGLVRIASGRDAADIAFMTIFGRGQLLQQSFDVTRIESEVPSRVSEAA